MVYLDQYQLLTRDSNGNWQLKLNGTEPQRYATAQEALDAGRLLTDDWTNNILVTDNIEFTATATITP